MAITDDLAWIQDTSTATFKLFNGSKVYFNVDNITWTGTNVVKVDPKIMQNVNFLTTENVTNTRFQQRWNRLKNDGQHTAFEETIWTLSGMLHEPQENIFNAPTNSFDLNDIFAKFDFMLDAPFDSDSVATVTQSIVPMLSENRLFALRNFPRTLYLYEPLLIKKLIRSGTTNLTNGVYSFYTTTGVPIIVRSVSITANREGASTFNITFVEDKEL